MAQAVAAVGVTGQAGHEKTWIWRDEYNGTERTVEENKE
jgi:hypothetical protein